MQPIIAHIDMNSYFATVEQQDNPAWRGHPVAVCEHLGGIIIAASVEAKRWGIKTGTPVWEARRIYPKIILTKTSPERYRFYTARFLKVFEDYTDRVEKYSIDEAFLDLTKSCNIRGYKDGILQKLDPWQEAARVINEIKTRMKTEVGDWITCSAGVSYSKLVAKIASDLQKPDGLVIVRSEDKAALYDRLALTDIPGIGSRMEIRLNKLGVKTLSELRDFPLTKLISYFGIQGYHLHSMGQLEGSWKEEFADNDDQPETASMKSIGHMYTIPQEFRKQKIMKPVLYKLSEMVGARLRVNGLAGGVVHVHVHDPERLCANRGGKIGYSVQDGRDIYLECLALLKQTGISMEELESKSYLVGVTVAGLQPVIEQPSLFKTKRHTGKLMEALDIINQKYEDFTIARVPAFLARDIIRDSIGFGRMKEFKTTFMRGGQGGFK